MAAKRARELVRTKSILKSSSLPGKLADCSSTNPEESGKFTSVNLFFISYYMSWRAAFLDSFILWFDIACQQYTFYLSFVELHGEKKNTNDKLLPPLFVIFLRLILGLVFH